MKLNAAALFVFVIFAIFTAPARADEGHSYQGDAGGSTSFFLIGGQYSLYVNASFPFSARRFHRSCVFAGHFSRLLPTQDTLHLGGPAQISAGIDYRLGPSSVALPAGLYRLYIAPSTDCRWRFTIVSTAQNSAGVASVQMIKTDGGNLKPIAAASLHDKVQFSADFRTDHNAQEIVSGTMQIIHDGQVVRTLPLRFGTALPARSQFFFVDVQWGPEDAKYVGTSSVKFAVKIGPEEFTSTGDFTLTP